MAMDVVSLFITGVTDSGTVLYNNELFPFTGILNSLNDSLDLSTCDRWKIYWKHILLCCFLEMRDPFYL